MSIGILATGDELICGDTLNTNGKQIAHQLHASGLEVGTHMTTGDALDDIIHALDFLSLKHHTIIIMGGLGPTSDDRTRFALAQWTQEELIPHQEALLHIEQRLSKLNLNLNAGNRQQALFPKQAIPLPNPHGSAMGCEFLHQNIRYFLLPGPPSECLPMFQEHVLPKLEGKKLETMVQLKWLLFAVMESQIAEKMEEALSHFPCELGYRLDTPYLEFKARTAKQHVAELQAIVDPILAEHILLGTEKASCQLKKYLESFPGRVAIIDEVTGGHLQTLLQTPTTLKKLVFFDTEDANIHFRLQGLEAYWNQELDADNTVLHLDYYNQDKIGHETHELPSPRRTHLMSIAVEWLCFRLLHLITQLHEVVA